MPPPIIPMCKNPEKVLNWPPSEMTKSRTCHPKKWQSPELATLKLTRVGDSAIFWGWQVMDIVISEGGQFRTLFFSGLWHIGKIGGGKKDQPPYIYNFKHIYENIFRLLIIFEIFNILMLLYWIGDLYIEYLLSNNYLSSIINICINILFKRYIFNYFFCFY